MKRRMGEGCLGTRAVGQVCLLVIHGMVSQGYKRARIRLVEVLTENDQLFLCEVASACNVVQHRQPYAFGVITRVVRFAAAGRAFVGVSLREACPLHSSGSHVACCIASTKDSVADWVTELPDALFGRARNQDPGHSVVVIQC